MNKKIILGQLELGQEFVWKDKDLSIQNIRVIKKKGWGLPGNSSAMHSIEEHRNLEVTPVKVIISEEYPNE